MENIENSKISIQPSKSKTTCHVFVWDLPDFVTQKKNGEEKKTPCKIFFLIEVFSPQNSGLDYILEKIFSEIKAIDRTDFLKQDPEKFFENIIQKINYRYTKLANDESVIKTLNWPLRINAALSLFVGKNIFLAQKGKIYPFLIHKTKTHNKYKITDIADTASGRENNVNKINLFNNIINGRINIDDGLLFTTENLLDYFSLEKLANIVSENSPEEAALRIKELLHEAANPETTFLALVTKIVKKDDPIEMLVDVDNQEEELSVTENSMEKLLGTVADTEKFMTPAMQVNFSDNFSRIINKTKKIFDKKSKKISSGINYLSPFFKILKTIFQKIFLFIKKGARIKINILKGLFVIITNKDNKRKETLGKIPEAFIKIKKKFLSLPKMSQISLVGAIVLFSIFLGSTIVAYVRHSNEMALEELNRRIENIQEQKSLAEASIIYGDQFTAINSIKEAEKLLNEFPRENEKLNETYNNLSNDVRILGEKIKNIERINELSPVVNFEELGDEGVNLEKILLYKERLITFGKESSWMYNLDLVANKKITKKETTDLNLVSIYPKINNTVIIGNENKKFYEFNIGNNSLKPIDVVLNENENSINSIAIYNQRLYTLSPQDNQIFKHSPTIVGFAKGSPWIKEDVDIRDSSNIAIDGSIYVLKNTDLVKMSSGLKEGFSLTIEPPLSSPTKIWTDSDSSHIYVFEPQSKRIVITDKEGNLVIQYLFEQFNKVSDFAVSEKDKEIYLLSENKLYTFKVSHL